MEDIQKSAMEDIQQHVDEQTPGKEGGASASLFISYLQLKLESLLDEEANFNIPLDITPRLRQILNKIPKQHTTEDAQTQLIGHLYDLLDIHSDLTQQRSPGHNKGFLRFLNPVSFWRLRKIRSRLKEIESKVGIESNKTLGDRKDPTVPLDPTVKIVGFDPIGRRIDALLQGNGGLGLTRIGILGRCGTGKTTLAYKVFTNSREIPEPFFPRLWLCWSDFKSKDRNRYLNQVILKEIGQNLSLEGLQDSDGFDAILERLHRALLGRRYLLVLDGVTTGEDADGWLKKFLSRGLPRGSGGAIIVTGRREDVIQRTEIEEGERVIRLESDKDVRADKICLEILKDTISKGTGMLFNNEVQHQNIQNKLIECCDGLPLAARILDDYLDDYDPQKSDDLD